MHSSSPWRTRRREDRRRSHAAAFAVVAAITATLVGASAVPTPLYAIYQERWALSTSQSTLAFGVYAVSLLLALLTVGSLSD